MGTFNCMSKEMRYWKPVAFEMMRSIRVLATNEGEESHTDG